jgi:acylphosphatase
MLSLMSESNETTRLHAIVVGGVQGVGFRAFVQQKAASFNLKGWVRNRWDGSVEVVAEGPRPDLEKLLSALYRGPYAADVRGITPEWQPASGDFSGFSVRMTSG